MTDAVSVSAQGGAPVVENKGGVTRVTVNEGQVTAEQISGGAQRPDGTPPTPEEIAAASQSAAFDGSKPPGEQEVKPAGEKKEGDEAKPAPVTGSDDARFAPYNDYLSKIEAGKPFELSAELTTKAAAEFGVTEDMVKAYVKGRALEATQSGGADAQAAADAAKADLAAAELTTNLHKTFETKEKFESFLEWAKDGLSEAEADLYNELTEKNPAQAVAYASSLKAKFDASGWTPPRSITGGQAQGEAMKATSGVKPYGSTAEMQKDMSDPRYGKDQDFTNNVYARMNAPKAST